MNKLGVNNSTQGEIKLFEYLGQKKELHVKLLVHYSSFM